MSQFRPQSVAFYESSLNGPGQTNTKGAENILLILHVLLL